MSYDCMYKFVIIGDTGVGKSSINLQFTQKQTLLNHNATIGVQFAAKIIKIQGKNIKIQIWDTAGQQNFRSIARSYYKNAIGALLVYDITRRQTFNGVKTWFQQLKQNGNKNMQIILVGNKNDLQSKRAVSFQQGERFANSNGLNFVEISARDYSKVNSAFLSIATSISKKIENQQISFQNKGITLGDSPKRQSRSSTKINNIQTQKTQKRCC